MGHDDSGRDERKDRDRAISRATRRQMRIAAKIAERSRPRDPDEESVPVALVHLAAAGLLFWFAATQPFFWWLVFPGLGFATKGAKLIARARRRSRELPAPARDVGTVLSSGGTTTAHAQPQALPAPPPPPPPSAERERELLAARDPAAAAIASRLARVEEACRKISAALSTAPEALRAALVRPEETVERLRKASREMARREEEVRSALSTAEGERLASERAALAERIAREPDPGLRDRLGDALAALDGQLEERTRLATAASRIEAEAMRVLYALETLRAQVLRAAAADASADDLEGASVRESLERLSSEVDAVASALEEVAEAGQPARLGSPAEATSQGSASSPVSGRRAPLPQSIRN